MNPVNSISYSPLTTADISRMPQQTTEAPVMPASTQPDTYIPTQEKKMGGFTKLLIGLGIAAAAIVGLKRFGGSLFKVADPNNMNWLDSIKKPVGDFINRAGEYIEKPFIASYNWVKGLLSKADKVAS